MDIMPYKLDVSAGEIGGKWKLELLYLIRNEPKRWSQLRSALPQAAPNALTRQLRDMEDQGLILRIVQRAAPPQIVSYALGPKGQTLLPTLEGLAQWSGESEGVITYGA